MSPSALTTPPQAELPAWRFIDRPQVSGVESILHLRRHEPVSVPDVPASFTKRLDDFQASERVVKFRALCDELAKAEAAYVDSAAALAATERAASDDPFAVLPAEIASGATAVETARVALASANSRRVALRTAGQAMRIALAGELAEIVATARDKCGTKARGEAEKTESELLAAIAPLLDKLAAASAMRQRSLSLSAPKLATLIGELPPAITADVAEVLPVNAFATHPAGPPAELTAAGE